MDAFAAVVAEAFDAMEQKIEKSSMRVPGLKSAFLEFIRTDKDTQEEIAKMMKEPGFKKSVSMNTPFMVTRDGQRFALTASPVGETTVQKSKKGEKKGDFKSVYKSKYSAFTADGEVKS